jgi:aminomethyltransferase
MLARQYAEARAGHLATRAAAGLFDFSFMGHCEISGARARAFLERLQTRNLAQLAPGKIYYTLLLRDDGSVFNDATLWCLAPERYWLFTGRPGDFDWIRRFQSAGEPVLTRLSGQFSIIALQGPRAFDILRRVLAEPPGYFAFTQARCARVPAWVARLGYSGERGVEILVPAAADAAAWQALMQAGVCACCFETANSLRIESGYILFANELAHDPDPFELGLGRLVTSSACIGAAALREKRRAGLRRRLVGLVPTGSERAAGCLPEAQLTSEAYSPTFGRQLGMGFAPAEHAAPGNLLRLADGRLAHSARLPFYDPGRVLPRQPA